jgi:hypothetical protein
LAPQASARADDRNNLAADRGPSSFDIRHRAVFVFVYDLPIGPGHRFLGSSNGINRQVFGGWQISGNTTIQSGTPFTVFNGSNDFSGFNQFNDRPDVVGTDRLARTTPIQIRRLTRPTLDALLRPAT